LARGAGGAHAAATDFDADAIVVGSGFGGAVTACRLAQAGLRVLLLERGRRYEAGDFPALPNEEALLPELRRWTWQQNQGLWEVLDLEEVVSLQAAGYGGGSLVYANVHLRPPGEIFDERWPEVYRNNVLEEFYDLAGYMLDAAPISAHRSLAPKLIKSDQLFKVARHLGREDSFFLPPLAVSTKAGKNDHGRVQKACNGCGSCCTGCPETAKNTLDFNYLAVAENHGARVLTQCEVLQVRQLADDGGWEVDGMDHLNACRRTFRAKAVFLCAGSIHSTRLVAQADLQPASMAVKSLVGVGYFPGGDALGMVYDTTHPQHPSFGPTITTSTVHWDRPGTRGNAASFFMIQDGGYAKQLARLMGVLRAPAWVGRNRLSKKSTATVQASDPDRVPPPEPPAESPPPLALVSPFNNVISAVLAGNFRAAASPELRQAFSSFLDELKDPLLLPAIVERTVDSTFRARLMTLWPFRTFSQNGRLIEALVRFNRWVLEKLYGTPNELAGRALRVLLSAADLPPQEIAKRVLGWDATMPDNRVMLLAMGRDAARGVLSYDERRGRMIADLDLYHLAPGYSNEERLMTDIGSALGGELRTNPAWAFMGKPVTVHNQGGCGMSDWAKDGVTTPDGEVHGCKGLFVSDGSVLCTPVGVNPSATITAIAERNILQFIRSHKGNPKWPAGDISRGAQEYALHRTRASAWAKNAAAEDWDISPPGPGAEVAFQNEPLGLGFHEVMQGSYLPGSDLPGDELQYRRREAQGRGEFPMRFDLDVSVSNLARFFEDQEHVMDLTGTLTVRLPGEAKALPHKVHGVLRLFVERRKPYGIPRTAENLPRIEAHERFAKVAYQTVPSESQPREQRRMEYELTLTDLPQWTVEGHKRIAADGGMDAWRDTSSLFVRLFDGPHAAQASADPSSDPGKNLRGAGVVHVDFDGFMFNQLPSMRVTGENCDPERKDSTRAMWAKAKFASFFFGTLQRIYAPQITTALETMFKPHPNNVQRAP
jgi:choline dehydrogenase-like flavoprotein